LACGKSLVQFDGREFTVYPSPLTGERDFILCLELDDRGNIWLGTKLSGLFKFTPTEGSFLRFANSPTSIATVLDENNNLVVLSTDSKLSVDFQLPEASNVSLSVFDLHGSLSVFSNIR
jgi:ligand-binding sensor domain-containing protein